MRQNIFHIAYIYIFKRNFAESTVKRSKNKTLASNRYACSSMKSRAEPMWVFLGLLGTFYFCIAFLIIVIELY